MRLAGEPAVHSVFSLRVGATGLNPITPFQERRMKNLVLRFIKGEEGQDLIEYALLAALIALAAITAMQNLGGAINNKFNSVSTQLGNAS